MKRILHIPFAPIKRPLATTTTRAFSTMSARYQKRSIVPEITLNGTETKIRNLLVEYSNAYNVTQNDPEKDIVLRVTGGWVRDKLLGDESNDLDIAINHLSGEAFTAELMQYISQHKSHEAGITGHSVHKIEMNPEKSKHLETCTTKLYGLDVDFVNLRNEEYTEESRIPTITYGTPTEDAFRRDATLNALFYNLSTQSVEDFTGKGLEDLSNGILRTPLPAKKTFLDDPLRCLRLIRFAARFGFSIDREAMEAMQDDSIRASLMKKISRERVGVEMHKILTGPMPEYGLALVYETGLYGSIFSLGDNAEAIESYNRQKIEELRLKMAEGEKQLGQLNTLLSQSIDKITNSTTLGEAFQKFSQDKQNKKLLYLCLILRNWQGTKLISNPKKLKNESFVTDLIIREGLKFSAKESDIVSFCVNTSDEFTSVVDQSIARETYRRSSLGLAMRKYTAERWDLAFWFNLCTAIHISETAISRFEMLRDVIESEGLVDVFGVKPVIDGKSLLKELGLKPGVWMAAVQNEIMVWQLDNPAKGKDECLAYVKEILPKYI